MLKQQRTTTALWEPAQKSKHSIKRQEASRSAQKAEPWLFRAHRKRERSRGLYRGEGEEIMSNVSMFMSFALPQSGT